MNKLGYGTTFGFCHMIKSAASLGPHRGEEYFEQRYLSISVRRYKIICENSFNAEIFP